MPSSTRPTAPCSAAAGSTAPSTARRGRSCWPNAARWAAATTGEAKITKGYRLKARHVIHTVGPVWEGGGADEDRLLAACYANSLALAKAHGARSIAFPAISTGVYGFPADRAAAIAVKTVADRLEGDDHFAKVILCCFSPGSAEHHERARQARGV